MKLHKQKPLHDLRKKRKSIKKIPVPVAKQKLQHPPLNHHVKARKKTKNIASTMTMQKPPRQQQLLQQEALLLMAVMKSPLKKAKNIRKRKKDGMKAVSPVEVKMTTAVVDDAVNMEEDVVAKQVIAIRAPILQKVQIRIIIVVSVVIANIRVAKMLLLQTVGKKNLKRNPNTPRNIVDDIVATMAKVLALKKM